MLVTAINVFTDIQNISRERTFDCNATGTTPTEFQVAPGQVQQTSGTVAVPNAYVGGPGHLLDHAVAGLDSHLQQLAPVYCHPRGERHDNHVECQVTAPYIPLNITLTFDGNEPIVGLAVDMLVRPFGEAGSEEVETGGSQTTKFGPIRFAQTVSRKSTIHLASPPKSKL